MKNLEIGTTTETPYYPEVNFNKDTGVCLLKGESYMEDVFSFYEPIIKWLDDFILTQPSSITFNIRLHYFNTTTSRCILEMLDVLKNYKKEGGHVTVNWYYDSDDDALIDDIKDMEMETGLKINVYEENNEV